MGVVSARWTWRPACWSSAPVVAVLAVAVEVPVEVSVRPTVLSAAAPSASVGISSVSPG